MNNLFILLDKKKKTYNKEIDKLDNLPIQNNDESRSIYGFYNLAVEHYASILHLCDIGHWGSAFALLRVCREAYLRGSYLHYCAQPKDWDNFRAGKQPATTKIMVNSVENFLEKPLFGLQDTDYLNDLTHTGLEHISRRTLRTTDAASDYPEDEKFRLLNCSESFAVLAIAGMIDLSLLPEEKKKELAYIGGST